ncbi:MAG: MFS transporter [bacterium]|nr:MFS transporter [bacterium]
MSDLTKLKIVFFLKFMAEAMFIPFLALYYESLGFSEAVIGIFIAIPPIIGISLTPIYSIICKNVKVAKMTFSIISIISLTCMFLYFKFTDYKVLLAIIITFNIFHANNFGLLEAFASVCAANNNTDYSKVRVYGSFAYVAGLVLSGFLTRVTSFFISASIAGILTAIAIIFSFTLHVTPTNEKVEKRDLKALFKNKRYFIFIIFMALFIGTTNVADDFYSTYLSKTKGFSYDSYGYLQASFIVVEGLVIVFLFSFRKKFKLKHLYFLAIIFPIIRYFLSALNAPLFVIVLIGLTRGITWGIHSYLWAQFIVNLVGKKNGAFGVMLAVMTLNLYQAIMKIILGRLIDSTSYFIFYLIISYILIFVLIYFITFFHKNNYVNNLTEEINKRKSEEKTYINE